jgi:hypothetical protein
MQLPVVRPLFSIVSSQSEQTGIHSKAAPGLSYKAGTVSSSAASVSSLQNGHNIPLFIFKLVYRFREDIFFVRRLIHLLRITSCHISNFSGDPYDFSTYFRNRVGANYIPSNFPSFKNFGKHFYFLFLFSSKKFSKKLLRFHRCHFSRRAFLSKNFSFKNFFCFSFLDFGNR